MFERVLGALLVITACKPAAPVEEPSSVPPAMAEPAAVEAAKKTVEPEHPWPVAILDVRGHEPLADGPRQDVWLGMDGIGATVEGNEIHKLSVSRAGIPERVYSNYLLPELYERLEERTTKGTVTIWADENLPVETLVQALYTSGKAGFRSYHLVVGKPGAREVIAIQPPQYVSESVALEGPAWGDLGLRWGSQGVHADVRARYDEFPNSSGYAVPLDLGGGSCVFPGGARPDQEPLRQTLDEMCTVADGKPFALRVSLGGIPTMGDLLSALAADQRPAACRMPSVVEADVGLGAPSCEGAQPLGQTIAAFPKEGQRLSVLDAATAEIEADDVGNDDEDVWGGLTGTEVGEAFGLGGTGSGYERVGKRVPRVRQDKATVKGPLDKDIIRRIVRAHINEVRHGYNKGLQNNPELSGRVEIEFVIDGKGKVAVASVASTTLEDETVAECTAKAVKRWKFPKPKGGDEVVVQYPFVLG
jgi:hypothetical protein